MILKSDSSYISYLTRRAQGTAKQNVIFTKPFGDKWYRTGNAYTHAKIVY